MTIETHAAPNQESTEGAAEFRYGVVFRLTSATIVVPASHHHPVAVVCRALHANEGASDSGALS